LLDYIVHGGTKMKPTIFIRTISLGLAIMLSAVIAACGGEAAPAPAPVDTGAIVKEAVEQALKSAASAAPAASSPGVSPEDVASLIQDAMKSIPKGVSAAEIAKIAKDAADAAAAANAPVIPKGITAKEVAQAAQEAAKAAAKPAMTAEQLQAAVANAVKSAVSEAIPKEAPFYEGKNIRLLVGYSAGGGYDTYGRAIARHIGKHIPGKPDVIVENMTGAGSTIAANYLFSEAKPDGLTLGLWNSNHLFIKALDGNPGIMFAGEKFGWIGAPSDGNPVCGVMGFIGPKTMDEMVKASKEGTRIKFGTTSEFGSSLADVPRLHNYTVGTEWDIISGYKGSSKVRLALQEKEVDAACWGWESMSVTGRAMLDAEGEDKFIPFAKLFPSEDPEISDLPLLQDLATDEVKKNLWDIWSAGYRFQRPWTTPPGTPDDRLQTLRQAFDATMEDPEFLADANKAGLYLKPMKGEEIEQHVATILRLGKDDCKALQFLVLDRGSC